MHKSLLEYIDVVAEETSPTSIILAVAELMRKEADASRETAKTSIFVFLDKLKNAGLAIDYTGLKSYFDADPRLSNVIQQFNDREIEFVGQGDEDEAPDTGAPVGEVPPEKKVNQMAKAALAKRESIGEDKVFRTSGPGLTGAKQIKELPKGVDKVRGKKGVYMDQDYYYHVISEASTIEESPKAAMQDRARANAQLLGREASNITTGGPDDLDAKKVVSPAAQKLAQQKLAQKQKIEKKAGISSQKAATPANMTKQMANFEENVYGGSPLPMNAIDKIQSIMDNGSAMKIDGVMVDTFTASVIMDIYNKVNEKNQDKMRSMPVEKLASSAYMLANRFKKDVDEGYYEMPPMDREKYQERAGLEGPFQTRSGKVVYYDPKEGSYYDPDTDIYLSYSEFMSLDKSKPDDFKMNVKMPKAMQKEEVAEGMVESINNVLRLSGIKK